MKLHTFFHYIRGKKKYLYLQILALFFCLLSLTFTLAKFAPTHAANSAITDPIVAISEDITPTDCFIGTTISDPDTHKMLLTRKDQCPAGTDTINQQIHQSEAQAKHLAYVVIPPKNASASVEKKYLDDIEKLHPSTLHTSSNAAPSQDCGKDFTRTRSSSSSTWTTSWTAKIYYHVSSNCQSVVFYNATIDGTSGGTIYWYQWDYAGSGNRFDCRYIFNGSHSVIDLGLAQYPDSYGFEFRLAGGYCIGQTFTTEITPIN